MKLTRVLLLLTVFLCASIINFAQTGFTSNSPFAPATINFPRGGNNAADVALNFNYYSSNNPISHLNSNLNEIPNTKGSRYFFDNWATGSVITSNGGEVKNDSIYFNLDKFKNALLLRRPDETIIEINKDQVASFQLTANGQTTNFERVAAINPNIYLIVLAKKDNGYAAYKSFSTTFKKADATTDGLMQSGNDFDEYADSYKYYVLMPDKTYKPVDLKIKTLKNAFGDNSNASDYLNKHKSDKVDEDFLIAFVNNLNQ